MPIIISDVSPSKKTVAQNKKIAIAGDHAALTCKPDIIAHLQKQGYQVTDLGCNGDESVDYPDYANLAAHEIKQGKCDAAIIICGTGIGISIAANRHKHVRAALCHDENQAKLSRLHNNANMLSLGARIIGVKDMLKIIDVFLQTDFEQDPRHIRRVDKLSQ